MRTPPLSAIAALAAMAAAGPAAQAITLYQIGNSLTWDTQPLVTAEIAESAGVDFDVGYHVLTASSLQTIWDQPENFRIGPNDVPVEPYGTFGNALPNYDWDFVTLQPHNSQQATLQQDIDRINDFIDLAQSEGRNADTTFLIHAAWPLVSAWGQWDAPVEDSPDQRMMYRESYFDLLVTKLRETHGDQVQMIPAGQSLNYLRQKIELGEYAGLDRISEVYRDALHLGFIGRFMASTAVYATITGQSPVGLPVPDVWSGNPILQDQDYVRELQEVVWATVTRSPFNNATGRPTGDFDEDGDADIADYAMWIADATQPQLRADVNADARVDDEDLEFLMQFFNPVTPDSALTLRGDFNRDGVPDATDFELWRAEYGKAGPSSADGNGDGVVDMADFTIWRDFLASRTDLLRADYSGDGLVNAVDIAVWAEENGDRLSLLADANGDLRIDNADFTIWRDNYSASNGSASATTTPEPSTASVVGLLLGALGAYRQRRE